MTPVSSVLLVMAVVVPRNNYFGSTHLFIPEWIILQHGRNATVGHFQIHVVNPAQWNQAAWHDAVQVFDMQQPAPQNLLPLGHAPFLEQLFQSIIDNGWLRAERIRRAELLQIARNRGYPVVIKPYLPS